MLVRSAIVVLLSLFAPLSIALAAVTAPPEYEVSVFASGINQPLGLAFDNNGMLFVSAGGSDEVLRIDPSGAVSSFASSCVNPLDFSPAYPTKMAFTPEGDLYVGVVGWYDNRCNRYGDVLDKLYRISPDGTITVAASGTGCCKDPFDDISGVAVGNDGNIYFADTWTAGAVFIYSPKDGSIRQFISGYRTISDILFDHEGNLLIALSGQKQLLKADPSGSITAWPTTQPFSVIEYSPDGVLYAATSTAVYRLSADGTADLFAGGLASVLDLAFDASGAMYISENVNNRIIKIARSNRPPAAEAGPNQSIELTACTGAEVILDGAGSFDPDNDPLTYLWTWTGGSASGANPTVVLPFGTTLITLTVTDGKGGTGTDTVQVEVMDTTPPLMNVSLNPDLLWPPNHRLVPVTAKVTVDDACMDTTTVELLSATSNEPDNASGDGNTTGDIVITSKGGLLLRAERSGQGNGRIYTVTYSATDIGGNTSTASASVAVPHDRR